MKVLETDFQRVYPGFWQQFEKKVDDHFLTSTQGMSDGEILAARLADAMGWKELNEYERNNLLAEEWVKKLW